MARGSLTERTSEPLTQRSSRVPRFSLLFPVTSSQLSVPSAIKTKQKRERDAWRASLLLSPIIAPARAGRGSREEDAKDNSASALVSARNGCSLRHHHHRFANYLDPELDKTKKPSQARANWQADGPDGLHGHDLELGTTRGAGQGARYIPAGTPSAARAGHQVGVQLGADSARQLRRPRNFGDEAEGEATSSVSVSTSHGGTPSSFKQPPLYVQSPRKHSVDLLLSPRCCAPMCCLF